MLKTLEQVVEQLRREPGKPVRTDVDGFVVEVRAVPDVPAERSAADVFSTLGPWDGETTQEILALLADARRSSGQWTVPPGP